MTTRTMRDLIDDIKRMPADLRIAELKRQRSRTLLDLHHARVNLAAINAALEEAEKEDTDA